MSENEGRMFSSTCLVASLNFMILIHIYNHHVETKPESKNILNFVNVDTFRNVNVITFK